MTITYFSDTVNNFLANTSISKFEFYSSEDPNDQPFYTYVLYRNTVEYILSLYLALMVEIGIIPSSRQLILCALFTLPSGIRIILMIGRN